MDSILQVGASSGGIGRSPGSAAKPPKPKPEQVTEDIGEIHGRPIRDTSHPLNPGMTEAVISGPFFPVRKNCIGFVDLLESFFRIRFLADIWMVLARQTPESGFDLAIRSPSGDIEYLVIISWHMSVA
jgi:hypothetical protein